MTSLRLNPALGPLLVLGSWAALECGAGNRPSRGIYVPDRKRQAWQKERTHVKLLLPQPAHPPWPRRAPQACPAHAQMQLRLTPLRAVRTHVLLLARAHGSFPKLSLRRGPGNVNPVISFPNGIL